MQLIAASDNCIRRHQFARLAGNQATDTTITTPAVMHSEIFTSSSRLNGESP
jgi:hypothetical protein